MEKKEESRPPNGEESVNEQTLPAMESDSLQGPFLGFYSLPKILRPIVGGYISENNKDPMQCTLLDGQRITLCFSQDLDLELGSCWRFGCLSSEDEWESSLRAKVDKRYHIKDYRSCLDFLDRENTVYWSVAIDGLVFQLDISSRDLSSALDDIEDALVHLKEHLSSVQHVVLALEKYAFCCFSLKNVIVSENGLLHANYRLRALKQIISDLRTCSTTNQTLSIMTLLVYYIMSDDKPKSDKYLSKFIISLNHCQNRDLFAAVDLTVRYSKLMWIYSLNTFDDMSRINLKKIPNCHAFYFDETSALKNCSVGELLLVLEKACCFENNPFIERIAIHSKSYGHTMKLPRPNAPLTDSTRRSALIELSLTGDGNDIDLSHLNNSFFPHLAHLSIIGGRIKGRLKSQSVPSVTTLRIEPGEFWVVSELDVVTLVRERTQAIVDSGCPWQLVASQDQRGWSLASYDDPTANPQDEQKDDATQFSPLIREMMLVIETQRHADEFQSKLRRNSSLEAAADDPNNGLLVWSPERVEKIIAFGKPKVDLQLAFRKETRNLISLACHGISVVVHGDALPHLKSLEVKGKRVYLSGRFLELQTLYLKDTFIYLPWYVDAPMLQSLRCRQLAAGSMLSFSPQLLPHLSYLRIEPLFGDPKYCPTILFDEISLGLSPNTHVVFGEGMVEAPRFNQCQIQNVLHLELAVAPYRLPACWENTEWQCETLTIHFYENGPEYLREKGITVVKTPPLLLKVKTLTVTSTTCPALLDSEMPNLTYCRVPTPESLGPNLRCPGLRCIRFTGKLSENDKEKGLNRATYEAISARPKMVCFDSDGEVKVMSWDHVPSATGESSLAGSLE